MIELLMLGIVPGTNIQINFMDWLAGLAAIAACLLVLMAVRHRLAFVAVVLAVALNAEQRRFKAAAAWTQRHSAV